MCDTKGAQAMPGVTGERRLRQLEALFLGGPVQGGGQSFSIETLIDILIVLYDECCNSSLRREKTVSDFIEFGKYFFIFTYSIKYSLYFECNIQNVKYLQSSKCGNLIVHCIFVLCKIFDCLYSTKL